MKCKLLFLPLWAGLSFYALRTSAKEALLANTGKPVAASGFMENKGQITDQFQNPRPDVDFKLNSKKGLTVFIGKGQIHYQWMFAGTNKKDGFNKPVPVQEANEIGGYRMDVRLIGANIQAHVITEMPQSFYERYFTNTSFEKGSVAHSFRKITYKNIYPNIDWTLYIQEGKGSNAPSFKYDFIVHPGGKVSDIRLQYGGATNLDLQQDGSLRAVTPMGSVDEQAPLSYTQEGKRVGSRFLLKKDVLTFGVDPYQGDLIIDPSVVWSTYFGGLGNDQPTGLVADTVGNTYMAGGTLSLDNIATTGSYQYSYGGTGNGSYIMGDAYVSKFNAVGDCLWSTYYGGSLEDRGLDVSIDKTSGDIYLAGSTKSTAGIATTGAHQTVIGGNLDAFLVKFDSTGERLWSTYYGGTAAEGNSYNTIGTTCDLNGNVFLCGETNSTTGIATTGCYQSTKGTSSDAFIVKFNSNGTRQWGTYLGGNGADKATKITSDSNGNIYVCGTTLSSSGLSTSGSYQNSYGGGTDVFLASLDSMGGMRWSTYIGGTNYDDAMSVKIGSDNNLYFTGSTYSTGGVATPGSFQDTLNGDGTIHNDAYLASFHEDGTPNWVTYYGGENDEAPSSIYCSADNSILVNGYTQSTMGIATANGLDTTLSNSSFDAFLVKFDNTGQLLWGAYIGSTGDDFGVGLAGYQQKLFFAGTTNSSTNISTSGAYQPTFGGGDNDAFLMAINFCDAPQAPLAIFGDTVVCSGKPYSYHVDTVATASGYVWVLPQGFTGSSTSNVINLLSGNFAGVLSVAAINACGSSDSIFANITVNPSPEPAITQGGNQLSADTGLASYQWYLNGEPIAGATNQTYTATTGGNYYVKVVNALGCDGISDTVSTTVTAIHDPGNQADLYWYPNPADNYLMIHTDEPVHIAIYDMAGRLILSNPGTDRRVNLKEFANGSYMIRLTGEDGTVLKQGLFIKAANL